VAKSPDQLFQRAKGAIMDLFLAIVKGAVALLQVYQEVNQPHPSNMPSPNPMAGLLAQQQAAEAANRQLLNNCLAESQAQQMALLQQMMAPSPFDWW
jgi:hypothetical protein